jgi:hypothetical protein
MIGKLLVVLGLLLLVWGLPACGTIQVDVADEGQQSDASVDEVKGTVVSADEVTPTEAAVEEPEAESQATPSPAAIIPEASDMPDAAVQDAPAEWQRFYDDEYSLTFWHPPGTTAVIGEPARPVFSSVEYPDGIVEDQVFVVRVINEEGGPFGRPGPQAILEVKLVANPDETPVAAMADLFSKRCPGPASDSLQPTTVNVQLSGFHYNCEGIDGIIFNEFWAPHPGDPQLLFGAAWSEMSSPLADEILATVSLTG